MFSLGLSPMPSPVYVAHALACIVAVLERHTEAFQSGVLGLPEWCLQSRSLSGVLESLSCPRFSGEC
jgi:hypothetical protein